MQTENLIGPDKVMDVRAIPCSIKHGLIVKTFIELAMGDHFILFNDHDPMRMRDQFAAQWPDTFSWEHLANTPGEVKVKISKLKSLGELAESVATSCGVR